MPNYYESGPIDSRAKAAEKVVSYFQAKGRDITVITTAVHGSNTVGYDVTIALTAPSGRVTESTYFVPRRGPIKFLNRSKN